MKYIFYPIIIAVVIVAIYIYVLVSISKIYFKFDLAGISLGEITDQSKVNLKINSYIENLNKFRITFSDLFVQLYYKNELIASSIKKDINKYTIPLKGTLSFKEDLQLFVNNTTVKLITDIATKQPVSIDYIVNVKIFGIKIPPIKDNFPV